MTGGWVISIDWVTLGPAIAMVSGALLALCADLLTSKRAFVLSWIPMLAGASAALVVDVLIHGFPVGFNAIIGAATLVVVLASAALHDDKAMPPGEFQFLIGSAAAGGLVIVAASDVVTLLIGLELLTLPSIALVGLRHGDRRAIGTAWTFFLTSVVATAITLMGIALVYGVTGSLQYGHLTVDGGGAKRVALTVGLVLTLIGFLFKLGAVPFHTWVPDAYRGASPIVTAFLSSVSKAAALGALLLLLLAGFGFDASGVWMPIVLLIAAVTMTIGNLGALRQHDGVGVLAWSSVAQVGFLLAPVVASSTAVYTLRQVGEPAALAASPALTPVVQYLAVYALANLVAFIALAVALKMRGSTSYASLAGLGRTNPWVGVPLAFAVLTLAGFPPAVIGLVTKYVVFVPVIRDGPLWLAIVMAINVMLGLAYYLRFVAVLFASPEPANESTPSHSSGTRVTVAVVVLGALMLVALSIWPAAVLDHVGTVVTTAVFR
jgi:NADH-quinone oxidoreductase subunit N